MLCGFYVFDTYVNYTTNTGHVFILCTLMIISIWTMNLISGRK